jgi:hypothetical protein
VKLTASLSFLYAADYDIKQRKCTVGIWWAMGIIEKIDTTSTEQLFLSIEKAFSLLKESSESITRIEKQWG